MRNIWELFQDSRIERGTATADTAHAINHEASRRIKELEAEVDSLMLMVTAMWELFGKSEGLFLKDLEAKMHEIDLRDGKADGRIRFPTIDCPSCSRTLEGRRKTCVYCGTQIIRTIGDTTNSENS